MLQLYDLDLELHYNHRTIRVSIGCCASSIAIVSLFSQRSKLVQNEQHVQKLMKSYSIILPCSSCGQGQGGSWRCDIHGVLIYDMGGL